MAGDTAVALLSMLAMIVGTGFEAKEHFDVRKHLSTATGYGAVKDVVNNARVPSSVPHGCTPIHLNLVARHGTRFPTEKRMRELDNLASHIQELVKDADKKKLAQNVPAWLRGWTSPWKGTVRGGELSSKGEDELYDLGIRTRERFPELFSQNYHPDIYTLNATQVPRTVASAVAFGMGLFSGKGTLGLGKHGAFAVTIESPANDRLLRFHDCCKKYKDYKKKQKPAVDKLKQPILDDITGAIAIRYKLNFTSHDTSSLWFLCKQEASLLDITNQACALFNPNEIALLEWTDDLELFTLKGYGKALNYRMGVSLLNDVVQSMEKAIQANEGKHRSYEKARLRFAHAETVVPFSCLLGLFLEGSEFEQIQGESLLPFSPEPHNRNWKGSIVAPFGGNNMLVLYSCPANLPGKYYVQVLHNEHPTPMPGCGGADSCPFEVFKEKIAIPHLEHGYDALCNEKAN